MLTCSRLSKVKGEKQGPFWSSLDGSNFFGCL